MKKFLRFFFYSVISIVLLLLFLILITVIPVDRTPFRQEEFYSIMLDRLDSLNMNIDKPSVGNFHVGYAKVNLTPPFPVATAGYGNRRGRNYTAVHDSVYVRSIVINNGKERVAIVSADLLIIPPTVTQQLSHKLSSIGFSLKNTYLNATHTHNSIGNWAHGAAGLLYGSYNDSVVTFISDQIVSCIRKATENELAASIKYGTIPVPNAVRHRIDKVSGRVDSLLRVVTFHRKDSSRLAMVSYNAHPTCLFSRDLELSRDYPGELVDQLERSGYNFAVFLSGAVGSHGCNPPEYGKPCIQWMGNELSAKVKELEPSLEPVNDSSLMMVRIPLALGAPQVKIAKDWRLRPWVFRTAMGEYQPYLTALRIGDVVLLGTPCDFSGELSASVDSVASERNFNAIITSFNGQYIGYITKDSFYDSAHYETRLMNWYGPGNGAYLTESLEKLLLAITK